MDGIEATRRIRDEGAESAIIILTGEGDEVALARAIQAGARGFLRKTAPIGDVVAAIRRASRGEPLHHPAEVHRALKVARTRRDEDKELQRRMDRLTPREVQILQLMAEGSKPPRWPSSWV